ncbi:hypothetical protein P8452_13475 [Trifolium repens]|nr:hypothetical protein P8452_13475 [Trifolium repens]
MNEVSSLGPASALSKIINVLGQLGKVATFAFNLTEIFYCPVTLNMTQEELFSYSYFDYRNNASGPNIIVKVINQDLSQNECLRFLHWDLHRHSSSKITNVLGQLGKVASFAFNLTGIFYCPMTPNMSQEELFSYSYFEYRNNPSCVMFGFTGQ